MNDEIQQLMRNIPVVILAGGQGTRIGADTVIPKPMVTIRDLPVLFLIIDHYGKAGFRDFIVCTGYGAEMIEGYVSSLRHADAGPIDRPAGPKARRHLITQNPRTMDRVQWEITLVDTGVDNMTGSRLAQIRDMVERSPIFCLTYGDTVSDVNLHDLIAFHIGHKKTATLVAVHSPTRFRILGLYRDDDLIRGFSARPVLDKDYINGGFYVFNNSVFNVGTLKEEAGCVLETDVLEELTARKELYAFRHAGFWQYIDTERDRLKAGSLLADGMSQDLRGRNARGEFQPPKRS